MNTFISWYISQDRVEVGSYATLHAIGVPPYASFALTVTTPNGNALEWVTFADDNGNIVEDLKLDSGWGDYIFSLHPSCAYASQYTQIVEVCPCGTFSKVCNIRITGPEFLVIGNTAEFHISGLRACESISARIVSSNSLSVTLTNYADDDGQATIRYVPPEKGVYAITVTDGICASHSHIFESIAPGNNFPVLPPVTDTSCSAPVTVDCVFNKTQYPVNSSGTVTVTICNSSNEARSVNITHNLSLGAGIVTSAALPSLVDLAPGECQDYQIGFDVGSYSGGISIDVTGSYHCGGRVYALNGGHANAVVGSGMDTCIAMIQSFALLNPQPRYPTDATLTFSVVFINSGNSVVSDITLATPSLPQGLQLLTPFPLSVGTLLPNASVTKQFQVKTVSEGNYIVSLGDPSATYACGGASVPMNDIGFLNVFVSNDGNSPIPI